MRRIVVLALILCGLGGAQGAGLRPSSEREIASLLLGCWYVPVKSGEATYDACFNTDGTVETSVFLPHAREGFGESGTYKIKGGKLVLRMDASLPDEGWFFPHLNTACDVVIKAFRALQLTNCAGRPENSVTFRLKAPMVFHRSRFLKPSKSSGA